jgi:TRAP-type C4-dicarboxylate transport system permease small subunit
MDAISKFYDSLIIGLAIIAGLMLALMFVGIVADVTIRSIGFNSIQWYSAMAEYSLLFSTMCGAPWLVRIKGHVVVESLTLAMPPTIRLIMAKCVYLVCIFLSVLFVYYGFIEMVGMFQTGELDLRSIDMPKWILFVPFPVGFSLIAIEFARYLFGYDTYYSDKIGSSESL